MSRAMRRRPARSGKQRSSRAAVPRPSASKQSQRDGGGGGGGGFRLKWASDIIGELQKVTWPSREETQYLTFVVLVVGATIGLFLGGVDLLFNWIIDNSIIPN